MDGIPNIVTKYRIPNSVMKLATTFEADGMKALSIPANQLKNITNVTPLNYTPIPTNPFSNPGWGIGN